MSAASASTLQAPQESKAPAPRTIDRIERFLFEAPARQFILVLIALMLVKTGIGVIGNASFSALLAKNPFVNPLAVAEHQYVIWNWLGSFLAWTIGASGQGAFIALHMLFTAGFLALFFGLAFRKFDDATARTAILLFVFLPVSSTPLFWVGYDSLTLPLILIALAFPGRWLIAAIAGVLLGMQHFEQGFVGAAALLFATILSKRRGETTTYPIVHVVALLIGVVVGKLVLIAIFRHNGIEVTGSRLRVDSGPSAEPVERICARVPIYPVVDLRRRLARGHKVCRERPQSPAVLPCLVLPVPAFAGVR